MLYYLMTRIQTSVAHISLAYSPTKSSCM